MSIRNDMHCYYSRKYSCKEYPGNSKANFIYTDTPDGEPENDYKKQEGDWGKNDV